MENPLDSKVIRCRYGSESKVIADYACFGWTIASKTLLNRFGNPLPVDARITEDDKREKCSWELTFKRFVNPEKAKKLYLLENEYDSLTVANTSFGKGRITATVFMSLALMILVIAIVSFYSSPVQTGTSFELNYSTLIIMIIFAFLLLGGIAGVIVPGILRVVKAVKQNNETENKRKEILAEAKRILEE